MRYRNNPRVLVIAVLAITPALVIPGAGVLGQESGTKAPSLDAQLLDDLDKELFEGLPPLAPMGSEPTKPPPDSAPRGAAPAATEPASSLPLARIGQQMRDVQNRIAGRDTSAQTQEAQRAIAAELAALIEEARQQCAACKQGGSGSGQGALAGTSGQPVPAPPRDSTDRIEQGTKEAVETAEVHDLLRRFWGHLPDKLRDEMQSSLSEQFLPKYETLIEDYYRRLAEDPRGRP